MNKSSTLSSQIKVVEASAGSGKTYALASRYVQLLFNPAIREAEVSLRNILAITFTNKAALEMKSRILEFIKAIALQTHPAQEKNGLLESGALEPQKSSQKAYAIMEELIRNYNFFQVQTIDSFINAILSGCAFKIGLSANFQIKRNYQDHLEFCLDRLIERAHTDKKIRKTFEDFIQQYLFLEYRTSWFPKKDMLALMGSLFFQSNALGYEFAKPPIDRKEVFRKKRQIIRLMTTLKKSLPQETDIRFSKNLDAFLEQTQNIGSPKGQSVSFDIDAISDYFFRKEFPLKKGDSPDARVETLWTALRSHFKDLCEMESRAIFNSYLDLLEGVVKDFRNVASKEDTLFLEELNKTASVLFGEESLTVEELYYRLATRFRHYLIDEFQDTSRLQWQNLFLMVEEAISSGGSLFYVGDKKQAIYGFRGGILELFDEIKKHFEPFGVVTERLNTNYRSHKTIVEFNNQIFSYENLQRFLKDKEDFELEKKKRNAVYLSPEEKEEILAIFSHSQQTHLPEKSRGYVKVECLDPSPSDSPETMIKSKLIGLIKELKPRFAYRDLAILVRDNDEVELITSWLLSEGVLVESERTSSIQENSLIKELISFLHFLDSPIDNLNFASFILGDIFTSAARLDLDELHRFIFESRTRLTQEKDFYLYKEFQKRYPQAWKDFIEEFFKNVGLFPLYEFVISVFHRFRCVERFPEFQGFFMKFLEFVKDEEEENPDLASFLESFEEATAEDLFVNVSDTDTIKVLTIHKSKGLEFPVVMIPFLKLEVQIGRGPQGTKSYIVEIEDDRLHLVHLKQKYLGFSQALREIYHREYAKTLLSELNNIYVALTRAVSELYIFISKRLGNQHNLARFLFPEESFEKGEKFNYPFRKQPTGERPLLKIPASHYQDWINLLKDEFGDEDQIHDPEKILKGEIAHLVLSFVGCVSRGQEEQSIQQAQKEAVRRFPVLGDLKIYETLIRRILTKKDLRPFFFVTDGEVFQEKEIVDSHGQTKRLDRLIVREKEVWIVDYKNHRTSSGVYHDQVRDYMAVVREIYPERKVRGFLLYIADLGLEEVG